MRLVLGVLVAGLALLAGTAVARAIELPPPPTLPTPTVPTVTVPLPVTTVTTPSLPTPPPPPPPVSSVTNQTQTTASSVTQTATNAARTANGATSSGSAAGGASGTSGTSGTSGGGGSGATASGGSSAGSAGGGSGGSAAASRSSTGMRVDHFQSSRGWIGTTGPKKRRTTTLSFVLPHAGRVILTVNQVSPQCVGMGHFSVRARAGLNRVRFAGRVQGRQLGPGTYRISIRTPSGQVVRRVTLVVVDGSAPSREELQALRAANTCPARAEQASLVSSSGSGSDSAVATPVASSGQPPASAGGSGLGVAAPSGPNVHSGVLGSSVQETARAIQPVLVALLALSILLLAVASLPRYAVADPRVHDVLARHRIEIAGLGTAALVAVAVAFFIG